MNGMRFRAEYVSASENGNSDPTTDATAGAVPVDLGQAAPEFVVGCGYQQGAKVT